MMGSIEADIDTAMSAHVYVCAMNRDRGALQMAQTTTDICPNKQTDPHFRFEGLFKHIAVVDVSRAEYLLLHQEQHC